MARKIMMPGFLALALLGLLVTVPLVAAHEDEDDNHMYKTTGSKPSKLDHHKTVEGWKKGHTLQKYDQEDYLSPPKGYWIKDVSFKRFNKNYNKAYFKVTITNGKKNKDIEVQVKTHEKAAVYTRIFYSWNHYTLYIKTYYVYPHH